MTEAPEKIWIGPGMPGYITDGNDGFYTVEYIRSSVALAMVAAAKREARNEARREASEAFEVEDDHVLKLARNAILALMEDTDDE